MRAEETKDFSLLVTSFYLKLAGIWPTTNRTEKRVRMTTYIFAFILMFYGLMLSARGIYFSWDSFGELIFLICTFMTEFLVVMKMIVLSLNKQLFFELLGYLETHFWHTNYNTYEKMILDRCRHMCIFFICTFNFFALGTATSYTIGPIIVYIEKNVSERIFPVNYWLDEPELLNSTPYYELALISQIFIFYQYGVCYLCLDNFLCITNLHTASQFRILQHRIENLQRTTIMVKQYKSSELVPVCYMNHCYAAFKDYVRQHQALIAHCRKIEKTFTLIVLSQVLLFSLLICLDGYLMLLKDAPMSRRLIFIFHIIGCICQLLMFTYSCDCLIRASTGIGSSVYSSDWTIMPMNYKGKMLRNDMQLVMIRSRDPCCLTASGFFIVSLETYTKVLSTAVSYFMLLRQY